MRRRMLLKKVFLSETVQLLNTFFSQTISEKVFISHHMIHLFLRFIDEDSEQLKSFAKSGEFESGPMTRNLSVAWTPLNIFLAVSSMNWREQKNRKF